MIGGPKSTRSINKEGTMLETAGERMVGPKAKDENEKEYTRRVSIGTIWLRQPNSRV